MPEGRVQQRALWQAGLLTLPLDKTTVLLALTAFNFAMLGVDVAMAHSQNSFFRYEMIPLFYAPLAALVVLGYLLWRGQRFWQQLFVWTMYAGVAVGALGTYYHLAGNWVPNREALFRLLAGDSPITAPAAFAGVAIFALATVGRQGNRRVEKLLRLVAYGFIGAVLAAFFDHSRLGFQPVYTIIPLGSGCLAALACFWQGSRSGGTDENRLFSAGMALNILVGLMGFYFHVHGDLSGTQVLLPARLLYRDPLLGPLLFCNLGLLGWLAAWPETGDPQ